MTAIIHGPMAEHGSHFTARASLQANRDVYYHDKPQYNHAGIPYRKPKRVIPLSTSGNISSQPLTDAEIIDAVQKFHTATGRKPVYVVFPGKGQKEFKGFVVPIVGYCSLSLIPDVNAHEVTCS